VITAAYLIAADGIAGRTRDRLGIARRGPGTLQHWMNLIFDTDLPSTLRGRRITSYLLGDINGSLVPRADRWLLAVQYASERGERPEDFDQARTAELVRRAAGRDDVAVQLFDARSWDVAAYVAERFSRGQRCCSATPHMRCRRPAVSAVTPASTTRTTWRGSSPSRSPARRPGPRRLVRRRAPLRRRAHPRSGAGAAVGVVSRPEQAAARPRADRR